MQSRLLSIRDEGKAFCMQSNDGPAPALAAGGQPVPKVAGFEKLCLPEGLLREQTVLCDEATVVR